MDSNDLVPESGLRNSTLNLTNTRICPCFHAPLLRWTTVNVPGLHFAFPLYIQRAARLTDKIVLDKFVGGAGNLNRSVAAVRFHAAGGVDGVTPQIVTELLATDDARHYRSGVDADPEADFVFAKSTLVHEFTHI